MNGAANASPTVVRELAVPGDVALFTHGEWEARFPGLKCGVTAAGPEADFGLGTAGSAGVLLERYRGLAASLAFDAVAVPRQLHGSRVLDVTAWADVAARGDGTGGTRDSQGEGSPPEEPVGAAEGGPAVVVPGAVDGLVCGRAGLLLAITIADCVPVFLVAPESGVLGLLHAGWRGAAGGVLEDGIRCLKERHAVPPERLHLHLGPAICGRCYEVGPEVMEALGRRPERGQLDLRSELLGRASAAGIRPDRLTRSAWCTSCDRDRFHSHRGSGGTAGRMAAFLGRHARPRT